MIERPAIYQKDTMDTTFDISTSTIIEYFGTLEDPRIERTKLHLLVDIVMITICAVICGADGPSDIEQYGNEKYEWLKTFLTLPNGIPSHDTIGRVLARIDPKRFQSCFLRWTQHICQLSNGEVVPIDGKTLRHSYDTELEQSAIHMVSAWATTNRMVLGQLKVADKSNEITAIPELIDALDIAGCIVTIDAIGCQKEIATRIIEKDADYILALKGNQEHLYEDVKQLFATLLQQGAGSSVLEYYETRDEGHGRREVRRYWTTSQLDTLRTREQWQGLQSVGMVEAERRLNGETTTEQRYYILSLATNAQRFGTSVRAHWGIENLVHWVLDVAFREDRSRIRMEHGPANFALIRHIALNLLRQEPSFKGSIKTKRLKAGWNNTYLAKVLCGDTR
jgi:predicted transposase YbfD/YdcC